MVAARVQQPECFYLGVAKKFNTTSACKVNFSAPDYGPEAVTAMCKAFGVMSTSAFNEFQLMRLNEDKTYTLVAEKFGPDGIKQLKADSSKKAENDALVERLVAELAKLDSSHPDNGDEVVYTHYELQEA